jgi:predicted enzyme related to lactoylglutathione lyase
MENVTGIGGVFFKAKDPVALRRWYQENLGVSIDDYGGGMFQWGGPKSEEGMTVWSVFEQESKYFEPTASPFMINYRVRDLDAMLAQLRGNGAQVDEKTDSQPYGKFGWARDCEGNRFELWQPLP